MNIKKDPRVLIVSIKMLYIWNLDQRQGKTASDDGKRSCCMEWVNLQGFDGESSPFLRCWGWWPSVNQIRISTLFGQWIWSSGVRWFIQATSFDVSTILDRRDLAGRCTFELSIKVMTYWVRPKNNMDWNPKLYWQQWMPPLPKLLRLLLAKPPKKLNLKFGFNFLGSSIPPPLLHIMIFILEYEERTLNPWKNPVARKPSGFCFSLKSFEKLTPWAPNPRTEE